MKAPLSLSLPLLSLLAAMPVLADVSVDAGADFRVRQEIAEDIPGLPGNPAAMMPKPRKDALNHLRFRPRVWTRMDTESFGLYLRFADEVREHVVDNGVPFKKRGYAFPDEFVVDNLYFEGRDLFDGFLDFRLGRQDLFDGRGSVFGLERLVLDGAAYVGSHGCYADMARFTLKPTESDRIDLFALYDAGHNALRWGNDLSDERPMNAIHPADSDNMDEWGGGVVWHGGADGSADAAFPFRLYVVEKSNTAYDRFDGVRMGGKDLLALGAWARPRLADTLFLELEAAGETGHQEGDGHCEGWMGYGALEWKGDCAGAPSFARVSAYYLSREWDPMWARAPVDSELFQYGTLPGLGFWCNMLYTKLTLGRTFGPRHSASVYCGPLWAADNDHAGRVDAEGGSSYKGLLSAARYDFPLIAAPKGAHGAERLDISGHVMAEVFVPGDYYESDRTAWFLRWELVARF